MNVVLIVLTLQEKRNGKVRREKERQRETFQGFFESRKWCWCVFSLVARITYRLIERLTEAKTEGCVCIYWMDGRD